MKRKLSEDCGRVVTLDREPTADEVNALAPGEYIAVLCADGKRFDAHVRCQSVSGATLSVACPFCVPERWEKMRRVRGLPKGHRPLLAHGHGSMNSARIGNRGSRVPHCDADVRRAHEHLREFVLYVTPTTKGAVAAE